MAPYLFSPPHLSYLHISLSLLPPIRPDARKPTSFRPLRAETSLLPSANGSARICFADGTEAIVGVRAEVEKNTDSSSSSSSSSATTARRERRRRRSSNSETTRKNIDDDNDDDDDGGGGGGGAGEIIFDGDDSWVEVSVEMAGQSAMTRGGGGGGEDESAIVSLEQILREGILADGTLRSRLTLGRRWHWRILIDILLLSPPATYPLPLLSLTTHLALLNTRIPLPISSSSPTSDEDPLFNDDWAAALPLYPPGTLPSITVLVIAVGDNIFFDPSREELAVADAVVAVSFVSGKDGKGVRVLAVRSVEPPGRQAGATEEEEGVWKRKKGGVGRGVLGRMVGMVVGVGEEILAGLQAVEL